MAHKLDEEDEETGPTAPPLMGEPGSSYSYNTSPITAAGYGSTRTGYDSAPACYGSVPAAGYGSVPVGYGSAPAGYGSAPADYGSAPAGYGSAPGREWRPDYTNIPVAQPVHYRYDMANIPPNAVAVHHYQDPHMGQRTTIIHQREPNHCLHCLVSPFE